VFYTKYFARKLVAISCNFFFTTKFVSISYEKIFKTKLAGNINFFCSELNCLYLFDFECNKFWLVAITKRTFQKKQQAIDQLWS